jgi:hypothetical protein
MVFNSRQVLFSQALIAALYVMVSHNTNEFALASAGCCAVCDVSNATQAPLSLALVAALHAMVPNSMQALLTRVQIVALYVMVTTTPRKHTLRKRWKLRCMRWCSTPHRRRV